MNSDNMNEAKENIKSVIIEMIKEGEFDDLLSENGKEAVKREKDDMSDAICGLISCKNQEQDKGIDLSKKRSRSTTYNIEHK